MKMGMPIKSERIRKGCVFGMCHTFGVENINGPEKVRLVFDAAAKTGEVLLND